MSLLSSFLGGIDVDPDKGGFGEKQVYDVIREIDSYKQILNNTYIPLGNTLIEIDLIMLHRTYIYVFESKNYSGWIFGSENDKHWTQSLANKQKYKFYNPILQNNTHIEALSAFLNIHKEKFMSIIVFNEKCEFKKVPPSSTFCKIIKRNSLKDCITKIINESKNNFSVDEIREISNTLSKRNKYKLDDIKIQEQINNIKNNKN